jgi:uncharacterized protein (DUF4415 family)
MKKKLIRPTAQEEAAINAGIAADPDTYELSREEFKQLKPFRRGKNKAPTKELISIRLSPDVLNRFRASGTGWQSRVDLALREWLKRHSPGRDA